MSDLGLIARLAGRVAYEFAQVQHLIPTYIHIIFAALFPIYIAAHASLSRPSSAAKPVKSTKKDDPNTEDDGREEEDDKPKMEGLSATDAVLFPVMAGIALTTLYYLLKWDKELLNKIMNWYMSLAGLYGVIKFLSDGKHVVHAICFPNYYRRRSHLFRVDQASRRVVDLSEPSDSSVNTNPLPGLLSSLPLPQVLQSALWTMRGLPSQKLTFDLRIYDATVLKARVNIFHLSSLLEGVLVVLYFAFVSKPWFLTNLMGFAFSYTALQLISPTTFGIGSLVLVGLFFYDIYMVFYTPMMVTVAKNLDIPIKLLFPRPADPNDIKARRQYSMLGLGDIVLPGIVMGLAIRFDLYLFYLRKQRQLPASKDTTEFQPAERKSEIVKAPYIPPIKHWASHIWTSSVLGGSTAESIKLPATGQFPKPYFHASLIGYISGMIVTLSAMHWSSHPQPALLYLVPGVLASLWGTALFRGEIQQMWCFSEEETVESEQKAQDSRSQVNGHEHPPKPDHSQTKTSESDQSKMTRLQKPTNSKTSSSDTLLSFTIGKYNSAQKHITTPAQQTNWISTDKQIQNGQPAGKRLRTS